MIQDDLRWVNNIRWKRSRVEVALDSLVIGLLVAATIALCSWQWGKIQYDKGYHAAQIERELGRVYGEYRKGE